MLISEEYRAQQKHLHEQYKGEYGTASISYAPIVTDLINKLRIHEVLDYGAGSGNLAKNLKPNHQVEVKHYEPARPEWAHEPDSAELVCCIDVLEHIEPELLDNVLDDLKSKTEMYGFFSVHTGPAVKILPDGRNAHLIQKPPSWWLPKIMDRWELISFQLQPNGFYVLVRPWPSQPIVS